MSVLMDRLCGRVDSVSARRRWGQHILYQWAMQRCIHKEGRFALHVRDNATFVFASPVDDGYVSMIALRDLALYVNWIFENPTKSAGIDLKVSPEDVHWDDLVKAFIPVSGGKTVNLRLSQEQYFVFHPPHNELRCSLISMLTLKSLLMTLKLSAGFKLLADFGQFGETS